ncbi:putative quinol monooxygenase [Streptomyces sp. NPDC058665]|uniref:putative quinol monooxygenase n=1 Tax=Streptomyces sp. NPDC058665 TaxID=3346586 RepID=UPI00364CD4A5
MFTVFVTLTVKPELVDDFLEGIHVNARASLRDEPGCLRFDVHRSTEKANVFHLYEIYADERSFRVSHRRAPHYTAWRAVAERYVEPGGHVNTFGAPAFPDDITENHRRPARHRDPESHR